MNRGVGGIVELAEDVAVGRVGQDLVGLGDGAFHAVGAGGQDDFRSEGRSRTRRSSAHGLGHGEDELVALDGGDEGERDAGVAAGGLDEDGFAGGDFARLSASSIMAMPMRSFTLERGFWLSSLATTVAGSPADTRLRRTRGFFQSVQSHLRQYAP